MNYEAFQTLAFTKYNIPNEILLTVRPWVMKELMPWDSEGRLITDSRSDSLGYAELRDIDTVEQGMERMAEIIKWQRFEGKRTYNKFLRDAGGRVGKGFYRIALKTCYLVNME